jgi:hypothetical protein
MKDKMIWTKFAASALARDNSLAREWDRLNAACQDLPFMTAASVATALHCFGSGAEQLFVARRQGQAVAMLVLVRQREQWITFQPSQLPLGACVMDPALSLEEVTGSLMHGPLGLVLVLSLTQLDPWLLPRPQQDDAVRCTDYIATAWIDVQGSFEAYWNARGKNLRQNMRKQRNKLAAEGIACTTRRLTDVADMAAAVERYGRLESAGWKSGKGTAVRNDNNQGQFYRELLEAAARCGEAVVYEGLFGEQTVAMNLCLRRNGTLVILKTAYDESIQGGYSPAFLLHQDLVEGVFNEGGIQRIEYYGRLMEWHTRWTSQQRVLYHLTRYRWPVLRAIAEWRRARTARQADAGTSAAVPAPAPAPAQVPAPAPVAANGAH